MSIRTTLRRMLARVTGLVRGRDSSEQRLREEFELHIALATEDYVRSGMSEAEALRQARLEFGAYEATKESYRDQRGLPWLESLAADALFGWRQLRKHRLASVVAVLSLALATGACIAAFRLMDAVLWRPLPVAHAERLYVLSRAGLGFDGKPAEFDGWAYPAFQRMRDRTRGEAELLAVSYTQQMELTYSSDQQLEQANVQYVSGRLFPAFGLTPAAGRLLSENDDRQPGAHPYLVLSHDYWVRRFAADPQVVGRSVHLADRVFEIVGVGPAGFVGTETGYATDLFVPAIMDPSAVRDDNTWHRTLAMVAPGTALEPLRQKLQATSRAFEEERAKKIKGMSRASIDRFLDQTLVLNSAAAGASQLQQSYRRSLAILGLLVLLVLLIACVNVANLMTARAAARAREMALRVSIGAGRRRLVQLVLVESAMLAAVAVALGALFAWWAAPFVVGQLDSPNNPVRLALPADFRVLGFGVLLTLGVLLLFGLLPAWRASGVKPVSALKGGEEQPRSRRRTVNILIAAQVAFCFLVLFVAGLFSATLVQLSNRPLGFSADRLLTLETIAQQPQPLVVWTQLADALRSVNGVDSVALASWPLLRGGATNSFISVNGAPPGPELAYFLNVSPGWIGTMKIPLVNGQDFRSDGLGPKAAIVNETFARQYFGGQNPVGQTFVRGANNDRYVIIGLVKDAPYRSLREPILPVAYVPLTLAADPGGTPPPMRGETFLIRTTGADPLSLADVLRKTMAKARPDFHIRSTSTQRALVDAQTLRERLLAMLALFFAALAILLAGIGLYGVLDYSVWQRHREIGIRMAIGAQGSGIVRLVTREVFVMVLLGAALGAAGGVASGRYLESLLYHVQPDGLGMLLAPFVILLAVALFAAIRPVLRAVRIDPVQMLRAE